MTPLEEKARYTREERLEEALRKLKNFIAPWNPDCTCGLGNEDGCESRFANNVKAYIDAVVRAALASPSDMGATPPEEPRYTREEAIAAHRAADPHWPQTEDDFVAALEKKP